MKDGRELWHEKKKVRKFKGKKKKKFEEKRKEEKEGEKDNL